MPAPSFPLPYGPIFPVEQEMEPRLNVSTYGDGYEQASGDGINIFKPTTDVVWEGLSKAEQDTVFEFLKERSGTKPFMWMYPGEGVETKWVCRKWRKRFLGPNNYGINASFARSFNPA